MRSTSAFVIIVYLLLSAAAPPSARAYTETPDPEFPTVRTGTEFAVRACRTISAAKARPGDLVEFRTLQATLIGGNIVVPANSVLRGKVTEARPATRTQPSILRFSIGMMEWKKNSYIMVNAVVTGSLRKKMVVFRTMEVMMPSFLENVRIRYEPTATASTILSGQKDVVLRSGTMMVLRHLATPTQRVAAAQEQGAVTFPSENEPTTPRD